MLGMSIGTYQKQSVAGLNSDMTDTSGTVEKLPDYAALLSEQT